MRLETTKRYYGRLRQVWLPFGLLILLALPVSAKVVRIYVSNWAGDTVDVIDPLTNKIVQKIEGIEMPEGIDFSPDGSRVYISDEAEDRLAVVDQKTGRIIKKVPLSGSPNTIAVTKGGRIFVSIREPMPGALDVVDANSLELVKTIPMKGPQHDIYLTQDGKYLVTGSPEGKLLTVIDVQTEQPVWDIKFPTDVLTMAIESGPDGSASRIFTTVYGLRGFVVVDFAKHEEVARIKLPDEPDPPVELRGRGNAHGTGISPDGKTLWVNSRLTGSVFAYSLPAGEVVVMAKCRFVLVR
jgi:YVTN family beta-propeller protein